VFAQLPQCGIRCRQFWRTFLSTRPTYPSCSGTHPLLFPFTLCSENVMSLCSRLTPRFCAARRRSSSLVHCMQRNRETGDNQGRTNRQASEHEPIGDLRYTKRPCWACLPSSSLRQSYSRSCRSCRVDLSAPDLRSSRRLHGGASRQRQGQAAPPERARRPKITHDVSVAEGQGQSYARTCVLPLTNTSSSPYRSAKSAS
jgi:hypothetical protein